MPWLKSGMVAALLLSGLWASNAFAQVANTEAGYVGTSTGNWSGGGAGVVGVPDGSCSNMGAQGKANFISNFDFNVPESATITGITAFSKRGTANDEIVIFQLASDVGTPTFIGTPQNIAVLGDGGGSCGATSAGQYPATTNNNLGDWGLGSISPAVVNQTNFGVGLTTNSQGTVKFDSVCLQVAYTTDEGPAVTEQCLTAPPAGANLQVVKTVVGTPPGTDWEFNITGPELNQNFTLDAAGSSEPFASLDAGSYTITETTKAGYSVSAQCLISEVPVADSDAADNIVTIEIGDNENVSCSFVNTLNTATFTVNKDFSDDSDAEVSINLVCESGTVETNDLAASEGSPAVFTVDGAAGTPNCTATESDLPTGYTPDDGCVDVPLGSGSCTIVNTVNTGTFTVRKIYSDDEEAPVSVTATCDAPAVVTNNPQMASPSSSAIFDVDYVTDGVTTCTATESVPSGYEADESDCQDGDPINGGCAITNTPIARAEIQVLKDFTDDNPGEVHVELDCNTGLILDQDKYISEDGIGVTFVVTEFTIGSLACNVKEVPVPNGYLADYEASGDDPATDSDDGEDGCYWADIGGGSFNTCLITNTPDEVDVVITKEWLYPGLSDHSSSSEKFSVVLQCDNATIDGGQQGYCGNLPLIEAPVSISSNCKVLYGEGDAVITTGVTPGQFPGGTCYAYEVNVADIVEVDNGCASPMQISAGQGGSCTITNTVFYEGIPTLNQYGVAILALLMLGVGWVGFRRFV